MSTEGFNQLFAGYAACQETDKLRNKVQAAIANSICEMRSAQQELTRATFADYTPMYHTITAIDSLALRMMCGAPRSVDLAYDSVVETYVTARREYVRTIDNRTRQGVLSLFFPKDGEPTESEFKIMKAATAQVLVDLIAWLESIMPKS